MNEMEAAAGSIRQLRAWDLCYRYGPLMERMHHGELMRPVNGKMQPCSPDCPVCLVDLQRYGDEPPPHLREVEKGAA